MSPVGKTVICMHSSAVCSLKPACRTYFDSLTRIPGDATVGLAVGILHNMTLAMSRESRRTPEGINQLGRVEGVTVAIGTGDANVKTAFSPQDIG